jgi:hypothetical protein
MFLEILTEINNKGKDRGRGTEFLRNNIKCNQQSGFHNTPVNPQPELWIALKKHRCLKNYIDNQFMTADMKQKILEDFTGAQRTYTALTKFSQICKHRLAKSTIDIDLYMNPINKKHINSLCINQNSTNYWFTSTDLINHINSALTNSPYYYADPLEIKNPYTNIPFTNAQLYTIYFKIRASTFLLPVLFHNYFLCGFDLVQFRLNNESEIRENFIQRHIYMGDEEVLYGEIISMLFASRRRKRMLRIHPEIPKNEVIKIMRPYLYLYMVASYHVCGLEKTSLANDVLGEKLFDFFEFNPQFGRIIYRKGRLHKFNLDHPKFSMMDAKQIYL